MAGKNALAAYWNGSAWVDIVHPGTSNSAIIGLDFSDVMGTPTIAVLRIQNKSATAGGTGAFSTTFTDFMKIRIKDNESQLIYFYGVVYSLTESYDQQWGMVLDLQCRDYLTELKDNSTGGYAGFRIDPAVSLANHVTNFAKSNIDEKTNLYQTTVGGRSAIIKSLIKATTENLTFDPADARFTESVAPFEQEENYELGRKNKKSVLQHILSLGATDPQDTTANEQLFGYDFYVDPNFTLTTAAHEPAAFFNYFKKGTRPSTDPENYGLQVHLPDKNFVLTGRKFPMQNWEFDRPKGEILTDAVVSYKFLDDSTEDGSTSVGTKTTLFEVLQIKTVANLGTSGSQIPRWKGLPITTGHLEFDQDDGTYFPEWLQVQISGTWTTVARMQYINKLSGITNAAPAYILISDVDESIAAAYFNEDVVWRAKNNTSTTFTIKSRPRNLYGVKRSLTMTVGESVKPNTVRQTIAAALLRNSVQVIRGEFGTIKRPEVYFDDSPASLTGTTTQVLNLSGSTNPLNYGFHVGMPVVKLVSGSIPNTGVVYGYASAVTATEVTVTWNTGSGVSTSDTLRYFVPVRAGDIIHVKNTKVNIPGTKFLVTKVAYSEQIGVSSTSYTVVGAETNREGGYATKNFQASVSDTISQAPNLPPTKPNSGNIGESQTTCVFTSTTTNRVDWIEGNLMVGTTRYAILAGTTASTMISSGDGNTGQSGTTLAADTDYYIYYPGTGSALKTVRKNAYRKVVGGEPDPIVIGWCKAGTVEAEFSIWVQEFSMGSTKGDATKKLTKYSLTSVLAKKGTQTWTTDIRFRGTDWNSIKWFKGQNTDGTAVGNETTDGSISFGDGTTETISNNTGTTFPSPNPPVKQVFYMYKNVGDDEAAGLQATLNFGAAHYQDNRVLLALVIIAATDDGTDSPTILPFNGNQTTISAGIISAGAILAGNIKAGEISTAITSDMTGVTMTSGGLIYSGSKAYEDNNTGFILDGGTSDGRFQLGPNNGDNLKWTGSALSIKGIITLSDGTAEAAIKNSGVTWENVTASGTGATRNTLITTNQTGISTNATNIGNKLSTTDYLAAGNINDISMLDPRLLGQGTLSATTVLAGQMAVGGQLKALSGTAAACTFMTQVKLCDLSAALTTHAGTTDDIVAVDGAVSGVGVPTGSYLELVVDGTREVMRVTEGIAGTSGNIKVQRGQAGTSVNGSSWADNTVCNNPMRQYATLTATGAIFYEKHIGGIVEYTLDGTSTTQVAVITGITSTTVVSILRASPADNPLVDMGTSVPLALTYLSGARVEMSPAGIKGFNSSDVSQFQIRNSDGVGVFGGGAIVLDSGGMSLTSGGYIRSGTKGYGSNVAGFFLGWGGSAFQFDIGGGTDPDDTYLRWSGTTLVIKGSITLSDGTTEAGMKNSNVDSTETQLESGVSLSSGGITMGSNTYIKSSGKDSITDTTNGFFLGHDTGSSYDFAVGDNSKSIVWDGSEGTFTITGTVVTKANVGLSNVDNDSTSTIRAGTTKANVGLGNVPDYSEATMMGKNHTGNLNSHDFYQTSGSRIQMSGDGIIGYTTGSTKSFELTANPVATPFRVFGTYTGESSGNNQTATDPNRGIEFLSTIGGTTYLASISGTGTASQLRYDASNHSFMNFHQSGYLQDIYYLTMDSSESADVRIDGGDNALFIFNDNDATDSIHLHAEGTTADVVVFSDDGRVRLHASAASTSDTADPVEIAHAGAIIAEFRRQRSWGTDYPHIEMYGHIIPESDNTWDIGYSANVRFRHGYFADTTVGDIILDNTTSGEPNSIDGTRGHWIIQEGADSLYIKNELTGKKYRFKLEEV